MTKKNVPTEIGLDDAEDSLTILTKYLEAFIEQWEKDKCPLIESFLPGPESGLYHFVLVELIKVDLEYRQKTGEELRSLDAYLEEFPLLGSNGGVPADLIFDNSL